MKQFFETHRTWLFPAAIGLMALGLVMLWLGMHQFIIIVKDGRTSRLRTPALTIAGVLRAADVTLGEADQIFPQESRWFWDLEAIKILSAREVTIQSPQEKITLYTTDRIPANWMMELGIDLYPEDRILMNGTAIDPEVPIEGDGSLYVQYAPAKAILIRMDDQDLAIYSQETTLGAALEKAGINLGSQDWLSMDLSTTVVDTMRVEIQQAKPVSVDIDGNVLRGLSSATTVGEALLDLGIPLQNLDYSIPAEGEPVPEDRQIKIQRVNETVRIAIEEIPHQSDYIEDPNTPLDQISVIEPGQDAIFAARERLKFENDEVVWQETPVQWQASEAKEGLMGVGTKIEVKTAVVDGQTLEYWRKVSVYATSYSPCKSGGDRCQYGTASGLPVERGVVAVSVDWFLAMRGQRVYIPGYGYGVIADAGGGIPGTPWIDLAYSDEEYVSWHTWTTMYFLTPVPAWVPPVLYP